MPTITAARRAGIKELVLPLVDPNGADKAGAGPYIYASLVLAANVLNCREWCNHAGGGPLRRVLDRAVACLRR